MASGSTQEFAAYDIKVGEPNRTGPLPAAVSLDIRISRFIGAGSTRITRKEMIEMVIIEVDLDTREVVRQLGEFACFADAYGYLQTQLQSWMPGTSELPELNIHNRGIFRLPSGDRAFVITQVTA